MKNPISAAGTARSVSRMMRKAGFKMADTSDRFRWTEGVHVHRIGYSRFVSVDYHVPHTLDVQGDRQKRREEREKILAWLVERGYPLDGNRQTVIVCQGD